MKKAGCQPTTIFLIKEHRRNHLYLLHFYLIFCHSAPQWAPLIWVSSYSYCFIVRYINMNVLSKKCANTFFFLPSQPERYTLSTNYTTQWFHSSCLISIRSVSKCDNSQYGLITCILYITLPQRLASTEVLCESRLSAQQQIFWYLDIYLWQGFDNNSFFLSWQSKTAAELKLTMILDRKEL